MNHQDALISDVLVVVDSSCENGMAGCVDRLKAAGLMVENVDEGNGVVEGSVECKHLGALEKLAGVKYCRVVGTYVADYPPGDPRDLDGAEE